VRRARLIGFVVAGVAAAICGILLTSKAASYYPNLGNGLLLPAYAAAFLGLSLGRGWRFNVVGTVLGVFFLGTITTGLVMMDQPPWVASIIQGSLLLASIVVLARRSGGLFR
jgi:ribose/xylose/arabinose/galactoside ABC-type transport system permease subunit